MQRLEDRYEEARNDDPWQHGHDGTIGRIQEYAHGPRRGGRTKPNGRHQVQETNEIPGNDPRRRSAAIARRRPGYRCRRQAYEHIAPPRTGSKRRGQFTFGVQKQEKYAQSPQDIYGNRQRERYPKQGRSRRAVARQYEAEHRKRGQGRDAKAYHSRPR